MGDEKRDPFATAGMMHESVHLLARLVGTERTKSLICRNLISDLCLKSHHIIADISPRHHRRRIPCHNV